MYKFLRFRYPLDDAQLATQINAVAAQGYVIDKVVLLSPRSGEELFLVLRHHTCPAVPWRVPGVYAETQET